MLNLCQDFLTLEGDQSDIDNLLKILEDIKNV